MCNDPRCKAERQQLREENARLRSLAEEYIEFRAKMPGIVRETVDRTMNRLDGEETPA